MDPILDIRQIGKKYRIDHQVRPYLTLRERIGDIFRKNSYKEDFWALQDVSFSVMPGESIGIIGRNGAGKSTLLKILSRITPPTTGKIISRGRIASLLEVGTGFHPELTGRENIFLNGSILGMKRQEIVKYFDAMVDFAGTEKFLDTPLKHYSSGMQLRLAFAVAAFLEPEILIVDEVLAVGDVEFQKKCLGKMEDVSKSGRTLLFVSHNLTILENLCERAILLQQGNVLLNAKSRDVVNAYLNSIQEPARTGSIEKKNRKGNGHLRFVSIQIAGEGGLIIPGKKLRFELMIMNESVEVGSLIQLAITVFDSQRVKLLTLDNLYTSQKIVCKNAMFTVSCEIPALNLVPGQYHVDLWCANHFETYDQVEEVSTFVVGEADIFGTGKIHNQQQHGYYLAPNNWSNI